MAMAVACQRHRRIQRLYMRGESPQLKIRYVLTEELGLLLPDYVKQYYPNQKLLEPRCRIALQMLECIEDLHRSSFVHRDIKPTSFQFCLDLKKPTLYLVNLGLARFYRSPTTLEPL